MPAPSSAPAAVPGGSGAMPRLPVRTRAALLASSATSRLSQLLGRGRGSVIGGKVALRVDPRALDEVARGRSIALVTGTNGKSTTTRMVQTALSTLGEVAHNDLGSNMEEGVFVALASSPRARLGAMETDEAYLGSVSGSTHPSAIVLMNLSREYTRGVTLAKTLRHWRQVLGTMTWPCTVVANVDDPNVAWAAEAAPDVLPVAAGLLWRADATLCARCRSRLEWDGPVWSCPGCGRRRPEPVWSLADDGRTLRGPSGDVPLHLDLPGEGTRSGALLAVAAASAMGAEPAAAAAAISGVRDVDGRYRPFPLGADAPGQPGQPGHSVSILLVKNPAGWAQMVQQAVDDPRPMVFAVEPWGVKDTATVWDVPLDGLAGRKVFAAGQRRLDIATWLDLGGVDVEVVADPLEAVRRCPPGTISVAANYSSFVGLRRRLAAEASR